MSGNQIETLKKENAVLRDLLETAYRNIDKARLESEKADDECIELKAELMRERLLGSRREVAAFFHLKQKYDALRSSFSEGER